MARHARPGRHSDCLRRVARCSVLVRRVGQDRQRSVHRQGPIHDGWRGFACPEHDRSDPTVSMSTTARPNTDILVSYSAKGAQWLSPLWASVGPTSNWDDTGSVRDETWFDEFSHAIEAA